jgi:preprotein translocase subunit SecG
MIYVLAANGLPWYHYLYSFPLILISIFLMLVILVQRGRGGGLTGALGGMGGQSAFGTKAGDLFTRITIVVAAIWVLLSMVTIQRLARPRIAGRPAAPATATKEKEGAAKKGTASSKEKSPAAGTSDGAGAKESKPSGASEPAKGSAAEAGTGAAPAGDKAADKTGDQADPQGEAKSSQGK